MGTVGPPVDRGICVLICRQIQSRVNPMQLRPYQQQAVSDLREGFRQGYQSVLFVLPTGGGKTIVFTEIARGADQLGKSVLILVHRTKLLQQAQSKLEAMGLKIGTIFGRSQYDASKSVHVSTIQSMQNRLSLLPPDLFDLIVIDEAHHSCAAGWSRVLAHFNAMVLGVTATPCRGDGRGLREQFDLMIKGPEPEWLTDQKFLADARVFAPPVGFDPAKIRRRMGDFDREESEQQLISKVVLGDCVNHYKRIMNGATAIAFCVSIDHCKAVANQFNEAGIRSESIDGTMKDDERESLLGQLASGEIKILCSCELISEGVDIPSVTGAILLRPTQSLALFLQMVGRPLRPKLDGSKAIILDHVGNYQRHGHHLDKREWSLDGVVQSKRKQNQDVIALSVWICPQCFATSRATDLVCVDCKHAKPSAQGSVYVEEGRLNEIEHSRQMRLQAALERQEKLNRRREQGAARTLKQLAELGHRRGMKYPYAWAKKILASRKSSHP